MTNRVMREISKLVDHSRDFVPIELPIEGPEPQELPVFAYKNNKKMSTKTGVLVLHGFTSDIHTVDPLLPYIERRDVPYRFPYLRGHGTD